MGKLIRMGTQERRIFGPKRLLWSRLFFFLGILLLGSLYQHMRSSQGLPSLWGAVSLPFPIKLAGRDLPRKEVMVSSDPWRVNSGMESGTPVPLPTQDGAETRPGWTLGSTHRLPRRAARPKDSSSPTRTDTESVRGTLGTTPGRGQMDPTSTASTMTGTKATLTPAWGEMSHHPTQIRAVVRKNSPSLGTRHVVSHIPPMLMTMMRTQEVTPRSTVKGRETVVTYTALKTTPSNRGQEVTTSSTQGVLAHTPTVLDSDIETNSLTAPSRAKGRDSGSSTVSQGLVGENYLSTPPGTVLAHPPTTPQPSETSTKSDNRPIGAHTSTAAQRQGDSSSRTSALTFSTSSTTFWGLSKKLPQAPSTSASAPSRASIVTQDHGCVVLQPDPITLTVPFPNHIQPSPSGLPPSQPAHPPKGEYPPDLFSVEERQQGWLILHIFGMMYVFVALAIVCDEYFVPALGVITDKLRISEDVAGATFMAAGGSAPELFTSLIGVFISHSNVGIGTIVGSAVFNILFVIGTCSLLSREILNLTWWPLFRDVSFYILDLMMLILFFLDSLIAWWESLLLLLAYAVYVLTMKWNQQLECWVKEQLNKRPATKVTALGDLSKLPSVSMLTRESSSASLHSSTIRSTIFWLMLHSLDPLGEAGPSKDKEHESLNHKAGKPPKAERKSEEEELAELPAVMASPDPALGTQGEEEEEEEEEDGGRQEGEMGAEDTGQSQEPDGGPSSLVDKDEVQPEDRHGEDAGGDSEKQKFNEESHSGEAKNNEKCADGEGGGDGGDSDEDEEEGEEEDEEEEDEDEEEEEEVEEEQDVPLSLEWPRSRQKQVLYLFLLPIVLPLWLTVPDVRRPESRKLFVLTFLGSISWIAMFSYLLVWWAHQVGETIGISEEIMGLTILAAGTSIPDLITSVIVARKGLGDMAVSSSVGSNIFDITVGLPVPWLLFSLIHGLQPVPVSSNGLFCAIVLLFLMLLFVISSIASCKWRMNKILGFTMFLLYFAFLIISVMLEDRVIACPVSV